MTHPTHCANRVAETLNGVTTLTAERHPLETRRLRRLHAELPGQRIHVVQRNVIASSAKDERRGARRFELRTFNVRANSPAEAIAIADAGKFNIEVALGHHTGKAGHHA